MVVLKAAEGEKKAEKQKIALSHLATVMIPSQLEVNFTVGKD